MAPDRMQLQNMHKRDNESFIEYARRWRDLTTQVVPPMTEREMIIVIMDTSSMFYYEKMVGYMPSSFANLVFVGERIEAGMGKGNLIMLLLQILVIGDPGGMTRGRKRENLILWLQFPRYQTFH